MNGLLRSRIGLEMFFALSFPSRVVVIVATTSTLGATHLRRQAKRYLEVLGATAGMMVEAVSGSKAERGTLSLPGYVAAAVAG